MKWTGRIAGTIGLFFVVIVVIAFVGMAQAGALDPVWVKNEQRRVVAKEASPSQYYFSHFLANQEGEYLRLVSGNNITAGQFMWVEETLSRVGDYRNITGDLPTQDSKSWCLVEIHTPALDELTVRCSAPASSVKAEGTINFKENGRDLVPMIKRLREKAQSTK